MAANDALREMYAGGSDEEVVIGGDLVNDSNDFDVLEDFMGQNETVPLTDPDTGGSDMDVEPVVARDGLRGREKLEKEDRSDGGNSHSSDTSGEDRLDRKRQRILARVLPAVMIKRSAQQERSATSSYASHALTNAVPTGRRS
jgi:hypothetical protein